MCAPRHTIRALSTAPAAQGALKASPPRSDGTLASRSREDRPRGAPPGSMGAARMCLSAMCAPRHTRRASSRAPAAQGALKASPPRSDSTLASRSREGTPRGAPAGSRGALKASPPRSDSTLASRSREDRPRGAPSAPGRSESHHAASRASSARASSRSGGVSSRSSTERSRSIRSRVTPIRRAPRRWL